jgi:cytosine/adenosine deaminase-related metal-dependent hydrolase
VTPVAFVDEAGGLGPDTIVVHANYLTDDDVRLIAQAGASVVHCPGSYRFFGHEGFRLRDLLDAGVNVCLGSDSLASNDTLSVLDAMRELKGNQPWLSDETVLAMGVENGLRALARGRDPEPDSAFCVFPWSLSSPPARPEPEEMLRDLLAGHAQPLATLTSA